MKDAKELVVACIIRYQRARLKGQTCRRARFKSCSTLSAKLENFFFFFNPGTGLKLLKDFTWRKWFVEILLGVSWARKNKTENLSLILERQSFGNPG